MVERELRSAKMYFEHKVNIDKFKKETFDRLERNIHHNHQTNMEKKRKIRYPKWILASVASVLIIGASFTFGSSNIVNAAQSLINQLFGSKEELMQAYPDESEKEISYFERHMKIAKENLTEEEFNAYSQLIKEQAEMWRKIRREHRAPDEKEAARLNHLSDLELPYRKKFDLKEIKQYANFSFPIAKPTYLPQGYKQDGVNYSIKDVGDAPIVSSNYRNGDSLFSTTQEKISQKDLIEGLQEDGLYGKSQTYTLNGLQFDFVTRIDKAAGYSVGMRVTVPEKGYKIVMFAEVLSKEEMEKVLLSMVGK